MTPAFGQEAPIDRNIAIKKLRTDKQKMSQVCANLLLSPQNDAKSVNIVKKKTGPGSTSSRNHIRSKGPGEMMRNPSMSKSVRSQVLGFASARSNTGGVSLNRSPKSRKDNYSLNGSE